MDTSTMPPPDPVGLIQTLDPDLIRRRLAELDAERQALMVLLRAALRARKGARS